MGLVPVLDLGLVPILRRKDQLDTVLRELVMQMMKTKGPAFSKGLHLAGTKVVLEPVSLKVASLKLGVLKVAILQIANLVSLRVARLMIRTGTASLWFVVPKVAILMVVNLGIVRLAMIDLMMVTRE